MPRTAFDFDAHKEKSIFGRYVTAVQLSGFLDKISDNIKTEILGQSVEKRNIVSVTVGNGPKKIFLWSQMHGNESTTTKAILDVLNFLRSESDVAQGILSRCTIKIIPIVNPDGAFLYIRTNANGIDLNRDAQQRSQSESKVLRETFNSFHPDFCFNMHDQRTIYNVGDTALPATISFLSPAQDEQRSISDARRKGMQLIVAMNKVLQPMIPEQIGRYDDAFNPNCVGDAFQKEKIPTVLFEAGHYPGDYQRERTREYIFHALLAAFDFISNDALSDYDHADYFNIPENNARFYDIIIRNAHIVKSEYPSPTDLGLLYSEILEQGKIQFVPKIETSGNLTTYYGHELFDCGDTQSLELLKTRPFWSLLQETH